MFIVYIHTNLINQKSYIGWATVDEGQSPCDAMMRRWKEHASQRKSKCIFHRAIRKYGLDVWEHQINKVVDSENLAKLLEIKLIAERHTNAFVENGHGYNMTCGGDGLRGYKFSTEQLQKRVATRKFRHPKLIRIKQPRKSCPPISDETREKMRILARARPKQRIDVMTIAAHTPEACEKRAIKLRKQIGQYDLEWNLLRVFSSVKEASSIVGGNKANIASAAREGRRSASGFKWKYIDRPPE